MRQEREVSNIEKKKKGLRISVVFQGQSFQGDHRSLSNWLCTDRKRRVEGGKVTLFGQLSYVLRVKKKKFNRRRHAINK